MTSEAAEEDAGNVATIMAAKIMAPKISTLVAAIDLIMLSLISVGDVAWIYILHGWEKCVDGEFFFVMPTCASWIC